MTKYTRTSMVSYKDIEIINQELAKVGSKVTNYCLDSKEHCLLNVMDLACSGGKFGLNNKKLEEIKKILKDSHNIDIDYFCEGSITGPRP